MPQGSPSQGRAMPQAILSSGFDMFQGTHSIIYIQVVHVNFDVYDTYRVEVSVHMLLPYSFIYQ